MLLDKNWPKKITATKHTVCLNNLPLNFSLFMGSNGILNRSLVILKASLARSNSVNIIIYNKKLNKFLRNDINQS